MANLTVEAGNFVPATTQPGDSLKALAFLDFYRRYHYDAVGLSARETKYSLTFWHRAAAEGVPVVAANLFTGQRGSKPALFPIEKPLFAQSVIRRDNGRTLGVIGFVSASAWKARRDTLAAVTWVSPLEMGDLVRRVAQQTDWLTVTGEFSVQEADSLVTAFPEIDCVVTTGIRTDQPLRVGRSLVIGTQAKGSFANYVDLSRMTADSLEYLNRSQVLDDSVPVDSLEAQSLTETSNQVKALSATTH